MRVGDKLVITGMYAPTCIQCCVVFAASVSALTCQVDNQHNLALVFAQGGVLAINVLQHVINGMSMQIWLSLCAWMCAAAWVCGVCGMCGAVSPPP